MWVIKKDYKDLKVNVKGLGLLDFSKESADTIYKLSLMPQFTKLIRYIEDEKSTELDAELLYPKSNNTVTYKGKAKSKH